MSSPRDPSPLRAPSRNNSARAVAADVLARVADDDAFASAALSHALERSALEARDRALATELVYGVLRTEPHLRRRVERFADLKKADPLAVRHLLIAAYQIEFLDRVPAHAAVNEAVTLVREGKDARSSGFVNAVLRKLTAEVERAPLSLEDGIWTSAPAWLRKKLERAVGVDEARQLLTDVRAPTPTLRLRPGRAAPPWLAEEAEIIDVCPGAYRYIFGGDPRRHTEFSAGDFVVQELGAQLVAHALGVRAGERVFDVCAGRGHKTALLAEAAGSEGVVWATDLHEHKLSTLDQEMRRLGLGVHAAVWDATAPARSEWHGTFDRVLVDAPCTGVGTLRRRPEIVRRLTPDDPARLAALQAELLRNAAALLRPNGVLVFATCSVLEAEGEEVLTRVADVLEPAPFGATSAPEVFPSDATSVRLLPSRTGSDGYFVACLRLKSVEGDSDSAVSRHP